jgi:hypothetical protein
MTNYGVMTDHDYPGKRERITVWSGPWAGVFEAEGYSTSRGYVLTTYNGDKVRVTCPSPRTEENYAEVDAAIGAALNAHHEERGAKTATDADQPMPAPDLAESPEDRAYRTARAAYEDQPEWSKATTYPAALRVPQRDQEGGRWVTRCPECGFEPVPLRNMDGLYNVKAAVRKHRADEHGLHDPAILAGL